MGRKNFLHLESGDKGMYYLVMLFFQKSLFSIKSRKIDGDNVIFVLKTDKIRLKNQL
jgi:hypothetical protein